jgi:hypothetical protein
MQGAIAHICSFREPKEPIVATDYVHYFVAKYYATRYHGVDGSQIRLLVPDKAMLFGWHLIRPADVISRQEVQDMSPRSLWVIGSPELILDSKYVEWVTNHQAEFHYDFGSAQWPIVIFRCVHSSTPEPTNP